LRDELGCATGNYLTIDNIGEKVQNSLITASSSHLWRVFSAISLLSDHFFLDKKRHDTFSYYGDWQVAGAIIKPYLVLY
jgi:hypothetical protein